MRLRVDQLARHLEGTLAPVYVLGGDEPLQVQEARDAVRAAAVKAGFDERVVLNAETGFDWSTLRQYADSLSLFGERRVIDRLLHQGPSVLATGGGAYLDERTRRTIRERGVAVWIRAELPLLLRRTSRRDNRPLLKRGDPEEILRALIMKRHPVYAKADVTVDSVDGPPDATLARMVAALEKFFDDHPERLRPEEPLRSAGPGKRHDDL